MQFESVSGLAAVFIILVIFAGSTTPTVGVSYSAYGAIAALPSTQAGGGNLQSTARTGSILAYLGSANVVPSQYALQSSTGSQANSFNYANVFTLQDRVETAANLASGAVIGSVASPLPFATLTLASALPALIAPAQAAIPTVTAGGSSQGIAYDSGKNEMYVTNFYQDKVTVLSDSNNQVVKTVNVGTAYGPAGIAYDSGMHELFVADSGAGTVSVISDSSYSVVANVTVGSEPFGVAYDSAKGEVFVTNYGGTVSVILDATNEVIATVNVGSGALGIAFDSGKGEAFVANSGAGTVSVIADSNNTVVANVSVGSQPFGVAYDSARGEVYVTNSGDTTVSVILDATNAVSNTVDVGPQPHGIAYDSAKGEVFVAIHGASEVAAISDVSHSVVALVSVGGVGGSPYAVAYDSGKGEVFVTNGLDPTVSSATISIIADSISGTTTTVTTTHTTTTIPTTTHSTSTLACTPSTTAPGATSAGVGPWAPSNCYPTVIDSQSCPTSGGYIYCVGGFDSSGPTDSVYFAPVTSNGVGAWKSTTAYPFPVGAQACDISGGYLYCVGGITGSDSYTNEVFLAPVNSTGVGEWHTTIGFPTYIYDQSCAISGGFIYCVAGNNRIRDSATSALAISDAVYFAPIFPGGVGAWLETTTYPLFDESLSCGTSGGFLYCVGGFTMSRTVNSSTTTYVPGITSSVYFAPVTSNGVGNWTSTTAYPTTIYGEACDISGGVGYCVGGDTNALGSSATSAVYYAPLSATGVGAWTSTSAYPANMESMACSTSGGSIYCVGGFSYGDVSTNEVCYAQLGASGSTSSAAAQTPPCFKLSSTVPTTTTTTSATTQGSSSPPYLYLVAILVIALLALLLLLRRRKKKPEPTNQQAGGR